MDQFKIPLLIKFWDKLYGSEFLVDPSVRRVHKMMSPKLLDYNHRYKSSENVATPIPTLSPVRPSDLWLVDGSREHEDLSLDAEMDTWWVWWRDGRQRGVWM